MTELSALEAVAIILAGVAAGTINTVVGSGTLITFPVLLSAGYPPVAANVANNVGLVPGSLSGVVGYRRELAGMWRRVARLAVASVLGGVTGAVLLLTLPAAAFEAIVPVFIVIALGLIIAQPRIGPWRAARRPPTEHAGPALLSGVFVAAIVFVLAVDIAWAAAGLIAVGAVVGAQFGARYGRRLSPTALRAVIVVVGIAAIVRLLVE